MNVAASGYAAGTFIDGLDTDNGIFYKTSLFTFLSNIPIKTALRDISEFRLRHNDSGDTLIIYSVHLKASTGTDNELKRAAEVDSLRKRTNSLHSGSYFVVVGDFNIYSSSESAFQKLLDQTSVGYFIDPLNLTGIFNQLAFAPYHAQSTRVRQFGGGATGGLDDRFDMILISQSVKDSGRISYIEGSTIPYGNDGNHYNDSINAPPNLAVGQIIADALHYSSDHLPVFASFIFDEPVNVLYEEIAPVPEQFILYQNYPNPFNSSTAIEFLLPYDSFVSLKVFDVLGREVALLVKENLSSGKHKYLFSASNLPSGVYVYKLNIESLIENKKMILLR